MGGASSKRKNRHVLLNGSVGTHQLFNGSKQLATTSTAAAEADANHDYWSLSQNRLNILGGHYHSTYGCTNPASGGATSGPRGSQFYLSGGEHDSITYTSSLANLRTPSPSAAGVHVDRLDNYNDGGGFGGEPYHAFAGQQQHAPTHTPIYEDADVYIEQLQRQQQRHNVATSFHSSSSCMQLNHGSTTQAHHHLRSQNHSRFVQPAACSENSSTCKSQFCDCNNQTATTTTTATASVRSSSNSHQSSNLQPPPRALRNYQNPQVVTQDSQSYYQTNHHQASQATGRVKQVGRRRKVVVAQHLRAHFERSLAMSEEDRKRTSQLGLVPPAVQDQELQSKVVLNFIENCRDELAKYMYLRNLKDFNEKLFYYTLTNNVEKLMPLVYTPTVGLACQKFSEIYMRPRGLWVTAKDLGRVKQVVANWPERDVRVIVVTDGERILGLGDLGANGMGISIGKLSLYTALAGIPPRNVMPVTIDVGTNNEFNLKDPYYIGLRQPRIRGEKYDQLIEEFMQAVVERWGRSCLIQFEDFANSTAFDLLEKYRHHYCTFNDDIQGTASVSLSGLLTAARLIGKRLGDCSFLFYGAGEANLGTAHLLVMAMQDDGLTQEEARKRIFLVDSKGLVVKSRQDLSGHKLEFAQELEHLRDLESIVDFVKPTALIGASAQGGSFTRDICQKMATYNERPIIFALSNPTSKAECTAAQAYEWTQAKCVFASGSPFEPVQLNGRTYVTGQGNNAYIFPGVGLAAIAAHTHIVPEQIFLVAARALSDQVTGSDIEVGLVYPSLSKIREVTLRVATRCLEHFYAERLANYCPEPADKEEFLKTLQYDPRY